jgi:hypothetical protein
MSRTRCTALLALSFDIQRFGLVGGEQLTSSPRLKPGDSNPFMLREQLFGGGAVIPRGFLLVPASVSLQHPRVLQLLGRR